MEGKPLYDASILDEDWPTQYAALAWRRRNGLSRLFILRHAKFDDLRNDDGALGGVRVLMERGKLADAKPGMGSSSREPAWPGTAAPPSSGFPACATRTAKPPPGETTSSRSKPARAEYRSADGILSRFKASGKRAARLMPCSSTAANPGRSPCAARTTGGSGFTPPFTFESLRN